MKALLTSLLLLEICLSGAGGGSVRNERRFCRWSRRDPRIPHPGNRTHTSGRNRT